MQTVNVGIIGVGSWGACHLEAYRSMPHVQVRAICDTSADRVAEVGARFGIDRRYTSHEQMLRDVELDLVSVVTFEADHLRPVVDALRSGRHVLVEKPVSTDLAQAEEMERVARETERFLVPGHLLRFDPRYVAIADAVNDGALGRPVSLFLKRSRPRALFQTYQRTHTVFELTVHDIDLAIWYAGARVKAVRAYGRHLTDSPVPDVLWACLEFDNGVLAVLESTWATPDAAGIANTDSIEVIGRNGVAHFDTGNGGVQVWDTRGRQTPDLFIHNLFGGRAAGCLREELHYLCDAVMRKEAPDRLPFGDAVHGIAVAGAIAKSAATGREIAL